MTDKVDDTQTVDSLEELEKDAKANPNNKDLQKSWGWALYAESNFATAKTVFEDALSRWPDSIELNYGLGVTNHQLGDNENAKKYLKKAIGGSPSDVRSTMLHRMAEVQLSNLK